MLNNCILLGEKIPHSLCEKKSILYIVSELEELLLILVICIIYVILNFDFLYGARRVLFYTGES